MRLIDADALIENIEQCKGKNSIYAQFVRAYVKEAPTADAVPVVRCRDCRCWTEWANGTGSCSRFALDWIGTDADDFCSMGERKDND